MVQSEETAIIRGRWPATQEMPILDRVNQDLIDELAAAGGAPAISLTVTSAA
jgi:hypothetical protein